MNAAIEPARLYTILDKANIRSKDPILYQLLYNLIGNIVNLKNSLASISGSSSSSNTTINNFISNIFALLDSLGQNEDTFYLLQTITSGSGTDTYAAPLTNGNGSLPELIFDSNGDVVIVTGLTTP